VLLDLVEQQPFQLSRGRSEGVSSFLAHRLQAPEHVESFLGQWLNRPQPGATPLGGDLLFRLGVRAEAVVLQKMTQLGDTQLAQVADMLENKRITLPSSLMASLAAAQREQRVDSVRTWAR
jgi:hypothetical protein